MEAALHYSLSWYLTFRDKLPDHGGSVYLDRPFFHERSPYNKPGMNLCLISLLKAVWGRDSLAGKLNPDSHILKRSINWLLEPYKSSVPFATVARPCFQKESKFQAESSKAGHDSKNVLLNPHSRARAADN